MANLTVSKESATLADFLRLIRLRIWLILLILSLVVITTAVVTAFLPRWYLATAKIRATGWAPTRSIRESVELTVDYLHEHRWILERRDVRG